MKISLLNLNLSLLKTWRVLRNGFDFLLPMDSVHSWRKCPIYADEILSRTKKKGLAELAGCSDLAIRKTETSVETLRL